MTLLGASFCACGGVYDPLTDHEMILKKRYLPIPYMVYTRIFNVLSDECGWKRCLSQISEMPDEIFMLVKWLYIDAVWILLLAIYLNEVVPQQYGVPKHPLFFMESFIINNFPKLHKSIYGDDSEL